MKEPLLVQKQTIPQQKALDLSFNLAPVTPSRHEKHILLNFMGARRVFDFLTSMTSLEVNFKDTSTYKVSNKSLDKGLFADVRFVSVLAMVLSENWKRLEDFFS